MYWMSKCFLQSSHVAWLKSLKTDNLEERDELDSIDVDLVKNIIKQEKEMWR